MRITVLLIGCAALAWPFTPAVAKDFWLKAKGTGCEVWSDEAPTATDAIAWSGDCRNGKVAGNGKLNGYGMLRLAVKGGFDRYEAIFKNGAIEGSVAYRNPKGDIYEGEIKNGKPHGTGYRKTGDEEYLGAFLNGARDGIGLWISPSMSYLGEFKGDKATGSGVLEDGAGGRYHGQLKDGKPHGAGTYTTKAGGIYQGRFKNGKADGPFLVTTKPGAKAVVKTWKDGKRVK